MTLASMSRDELLQLIDALTEERDAARVNAKATLESYDRAREGESAALDSLEAALAQLAEEERKRKNAEDFARRANDALKAIAGVVENVIAYTRAT